MRKWNQILVALGVSLGLLLVAMQGRALADKVSKRMEAKTSEAMENYDLMEFEAAKALLLEAIAIGEKNDVKGEPLAKAYLDLGIVYFSGLGDSDSASEAFVDAVGASPSVEIGVAYRTNEIDALLDDARQKVKSGGSAGCAVDGIEHSLVDEAMRGQSTEIKAKLGSGVSADKMVMFYRSEGQLKFTKVPMKKQGKCDYSASIPSSAAKGDFVHYYVAAIDSSGKEVEHKGSSGSPNIIEVAAASGGDLSADDDNPLGEKSTDSLLGPKKRSRVFFSIAVGSGSGYINGPTEKTNSKVKCCFAPAYFHMLPEIGYYINEQLSVSGAFRMGFPIGANVSGHATFAPAGLLRVRYLLNEGGEGIEVSGAVGGGIIRNTVAIENASAGMDTDTTAMGPVLFGAGVGYNKSLGGPMRLVAELNGLAATTAGITELGPCPGDGCVNPKNGFQIDADLALLFAF